MVFARRKDSPIADVSASRWTMPFFPTKNCRTDELFTGPLPLLRPPHPRSRPLPCLAASCEIELFAVS